VRAWTQRNTGQHVLAGTYTSPTEHGSLYPRYPSPVVCRLFYFSPAVINDASCPGRHQPRTPNERTGPTTRSILRHPFAQIFEPTDDKPSRLRGVVGSNCGNGRTLCADDMQRLVLGKEVSVLSSPGMALFFALVPHRIFKPAHMWHSRTDALAIEARVRAAQKSPSNFEVSARGARISIPGTPRHVSEGSGCVTAWTSSNTRSSSIRRASERLHTDPFKSPSRKAERSRVKTRSNAKPSATPGKTCVEARRVVVHGGEEAEHLLTAFGAETSV
jgi:hypothetical protein